MFGIIRFTNDPKALPVRISTTGQGFYAIESASRSAFPVRLSNSKRAFPIVLAKGVEELTALTYEGDLLTYEGSVLTYGGIT